MGILSRRKFLSGSALTGGAAALFGIGTAHAASGEENTLERISKSGELKMVYPVWPPTVIKDPKGTELTGHFVEAGRALAKEMKVKAVFVEGNWATWISSLQAGQADISIGATYATTLRAQSVGFTEPIIYLGTAVTLVPKLAGEYKSVNDLDREDITVVGVDGGSTLQYIQRTFKKAKINVLAAGTDAIRGYMELLAGRADMFFDDDYVQRRVMAEHPGKLVSMFDKPVQMSSVCWAVRRGDQELLNMLRVSLRNMVDDGRMAKWEKDVGADWVHPVPNYINTNEMITIA